jgi:hypothetical protein
MAVLERAFLGALCSPCFLTHLNSYYHYYNV